MEKDLTTEKRSKRISLIVPPSVFEGISNIAQAHDSTINDVVNRVLFDFVKKNMPAIRQFESYKEKARQMTLFEIENSARDEKEKAAE